MKSLVLLALTASTPLLPRVAHAAVPSIEECLSSTETSLKLRRSYKLRAARAQLLVCSASTCPSVMHDECLRRIDEVNAAIPTVVFTVMTGAGEELSAVRVTMDGEVVASRLDGGALPLDPGNHEFTFEPSGQPAVHRTLTLREGEKNRRETVAVAGGGMSRQRVLGFAAGGAGVAGFAVGAIFGGFAASAWSKAKSECPSYTNCTAQATTDRNGAATFATVSTVGFIAGPVLLAGGLALYFTAPKDPSPTVGLWLRPGGLAVGGSF